MIIMCDVSDIVKAVNTIWLRLFDHRSFLNGEIQFFLKEFEQKRDDKEVESLFSTVEKISDIKDTKVGKLQEIFSETFPQIQSDLLASLDLCKTIIDLENSAKANTELEQSRERRRAEWETFIDDIAFDQKRIDNTFEEKEEELLEFYKDLERKLNVTKKL